MRHIGSSECPKCILMRKKAAETLCCAYYKKYKIPVTVVRPFQIFGPGPELDDGRLHIDFISQMLEGDRIVLKSDGSAKRTFMYITDAMEGMLTALLRGSDWGVYNIVDESGEATVLELAELMASLVSDRKIEIVFDYEKRGSVEVKGALLCNGKFKKVKGTGLEGPYVPCRRRRKNDELLWAENGIGECYMLKPKFRQTMENFLRISQGRKIIFFGRGALAKDALEELKEVSYICDNDYELWGRETSIPEWRSVLPSGYTAKTLRT